MILRLEANETGDLISLNTFHWKCIFNTKGILENNSVRYHKQNTNLLNSSPSKKNKKCHKFLLFFVKITTDIAKIRIKLKQNI